MIHYVTCREYPGNASGGRFSVDSGFDADIAAVDLQLIRKEFGVGRMPDGDEYPVNVERALGFCQGVLKLNPRHPIAVAEHLGEGMVPGNIDVTSIARARA